MPEFMYDDGDCPCDPTLLRNGFCDRPCNFFEFDYDGGDCGCRAGLVKVALPHGRATASVRLITSLGDGETQILACPEGYYADHFSTKRHSEGIMKKKKNYSVCLTRIAVILCKLTSI